MPNVVRYVCQEANLFDQIMRTKVSYFLSIENIIYYNSLFSVFVRSRWRSLTKSVLVRMGSYLIGVFKDSKI